MLFHRMSCSCVIFWISLQSTLVTFGLVCINGYWSLNQLSKWRLPFFSAELMFSWRRREEDRQDQIKLVFGSVRTGLSAGTGLVRALTSKGWHTCTSPTHTNAELSQWTFKAFRIFICSSSRPSIPKRTVSIATYPSSRSVCVCVCEHTAEHWLLACWC